MKYLLLMYNIESEIPEDTSGLYQAWIDFMQEANAAGVMVSNHGVAPGASATTVRVREGKSLITDGPFAETHEQLGGFSLIECENLDEAIRWAEKVPTAKYGAIEIRPLWAPNQ